MKRRTLAAGLLAAPLAGLSFSDAARAQPAPAAARAVLVTYADLAQAIYEDSALAAKAMQAKIEAFLAAPDEAGLKAARAAWVTARSPYMQSEVFRFGNPEVDDWEGRVNAWPLDEGLIDYVDASYGTESDENPLYTANIIASTSLNVQGERHDLATLTPEAIEGLHEAGAVEANVTIGYHAIEFLLWGQDLHGTGPGAGERPFTDYTTAAHADRRAQYLRIVTAMLVKDLEAMAGQWGRDGAIRRRLAANPPAEGLAGMLTGLGSLSYGELAGERMKLGLLLHDPEEEQDCFSDNTHNSHRDDVLGMMVVWNGEYTRLDGRVVKGASLRSLVGKVDVKLRQRMDKSLTNTFAAFEALKLRAETTEAYDQMLAEGNLQGNSLIQTGIDMLVTQTRTLERIVAVLKLPSVKLEGSESLDDPAKVFKK